jgi:hypothetical protein
VLFQPRELVAIARALAGQVAGCSLGCGPGGQFSWPATRALHTAFTPGMWAALTGSGCSDPGEEAMDQICLVVPITAGKTDDARDFMRELEGKRRPDYDRSERRIGVTKEVWYLARTPAGDQFVAYVEAEDFAAALSLFSGSQDEFDLWFKRRLADSTGLDLNTPPSGPMPELLSSYTA